METKCVFKHFANKDLGTKAMTASYPNKKKHKFELLVKISTEFDSFIVNIQDASVCLLKK